MSLLKHISDLDRVENIQKASLVAYAAAIDCISQYAVEVDPSIIEKHRERLRVLRAQVMGAQNPDALLDTQAVLQFALRDYHDRCATHLTGLRKEFSSALMSLQEVMSSFCSSGENQERQLKEELTTLATLALTDDPDVLRRGVQSAVKTISDCVEQMKRENDIVVAQFRDEMRTMQLRMEAAEASAALDASTGALKRSEFETRVRRAVLRDGPLCLVMVKTGNFRDIRSRHGKHLAGEALVGLCLRIREEFGEKTDIGRWSDDTFTVTLFVTKQDALKRTRDLGHRVTTPYVCVEEGHRYTLHLKINIGLAEFHASEDSDHFLARAESLHDLMG